MGYTISSILSISSEDPHAFFIYFIPGRNPYYPISKDWINSWINDHFNKIASRIGPEGVIIRPHEGTNFPQNEIELIQGRYDWPLMDNAGREDGILHGHFPFLIVSREPMNEKIEENETLILNLVEFENKQDLAVFFDQLLMNIRNKDWDGIVNSFPNQNPAKEPFGYGGWLDHLNKLVELKPNVFGVGINFNHALKIFTQSLEDKKTRPNKK